MVTISNQNKESENKGIQPAISGKYQMIRPHHLWQLSQVGKKIIIRCLIYGDKSYRLTAYLSPAQMEGCYIDTS